MPVELDISTPFRDPVLVFALVLLIIFFAPILLRRLRIPGIVGLILAGVAVGPHGFNLLARNSAIELFGTVGLLYIMFIAGLEIDLAEFKRNRHRSVVFGTLTFILPLSLGALATYFVLGLAPAGALLLASMFATHTLVAYPIVSRLGLTKNEAVTVTVGGTIITDSAVLLVLAIISSSTRGELNSAFWIRMGLSLALFTFIVMWVFPRIGTWFFRNVEEEGGAQYIFVMALVFLAAFLAKVAGVEPIIGAFLAGLALNRLVPYSSALMNRIAFVGNTLFIPFFLISVGMIVDPGVVLSGPGALIVAGTLIVVAFIGKWLAAFVTQTIFHYSALERNLIFGLSSAHAAATLAVILVGFNLELFHVDVLNGTILLILVTCLVSSFVVERVGRQLAIIESERSPDLSALPERILVPIGNESNITQLVDLALLLKDPKAADPLFVLAVVRDDQDAVEKVLRSRAMLQKATAHASATEHTVEVVSRVDLNVHNGITRAMKELMITEVIMGWNARITRTERIFGRVVDNLLGSTDQMVLVCRLEAPLNTVQRVVVVVPPNAEREKGFLRWIGVVTTIVRQAGAVLVLFGRKSTLARVGAVLQAVRPAVEARFEEFDDWQDFLVLSRELKPNDLLVIISARDRTISHNRYLDRIPKQVSRYFQKTSFVILYPEQNPVGRELAT